MMGRDIIKLVRHLQMPKESASFVQMHHENPDRDSTLYLATLQDDLHKKSRNQ
jgi:hypothetical protein